MNTLLIKPASSAAARFGQLVHLLASNQHGEVTGAASMIVLLLQDAGGNIHLLADIAEPELRDSAPLVRTTGGWRSDLALCKTGFALLSSFITSTTSRREPTERQHARLREIASRLGGGRR